MNLILFDDSSRKNLLPLTFTRPVSEIRVGILTLREKWEKTLGKKASWLTVDYLQPKFPIIKSEDNFLINAALFPEELIIKEITGLKPGEGIQCQGRLVALRADLQQVEEFEPFSDASQGKFTPTQTDARFLNHLWEIFSENGREIETDFEMITLGRSSEALSGTNKLSGDRIFIETGASVEASVINTTGGPVYIGRKSEIMEGSLIRGPFALLEESTLKMGAKIYGPTTIGPHCKVGGEVNNSVFLGYSNKAHDGFLGNSVIGEWCNLGADTNNSNLKNNYAEVKLWNYPQERFETTGLQFCGLIMGDHSKCGINTMFNTGTVVGVNANIYGAGFPRNFIPSFSWGGPQGFTVFSLKKAFEVAEKVMNRRNLEFDQIEKDILSFVFEQTQKYRK